MTLALEANVIVLRGNHDQRFVDVMSNELSSEDGKFFEHGGLQLLDSYCPSTIGQPNEARLLHAKPYISANYVKHLTFLANLPLYYEDHAHIYVHAGLNPSFTKRIFMAQHIFGLVVTRLVLMGAVRMGNSSMHWSYWKPGSM